jgi:predicted Zn-dependent peptidase
VGGNNNAFTSDDVTAYHETIPANHLQRLIFAEATASARWSSMRTCSSPSATW